MTEEVVAVEDLIPPFPPNEEVKQLREELGGLTTMRLLKRKQLIGMIENFEKTGNRDLLTLILLRMVEKTNPDPLKNGM